MAHPTHPSQPGKQPSDRGARFKRSFAQSTYITTAWTWFMVLAGKAAEPVLVTSVLYASVKLLPIVRFPLQLDAVVFVAQFIALDVGGLSLNKLADQALKEGNTTGAKQAKRLSIALVSVMLAGVIIAGIDQVVKLDEQISTVIDTSLLIARAIMAVLYSRVIHALKEEDLFDNQPPHGGGDVKELVAEAVATLTAQIKADQAEQMSLLRELVTASVNEALAAQSAQIKADQSEMLRALSQRQEQQINLLDVRQHTALAGIREAQALAERNFDALIKTVMTRLETASVQRVIVSQATPETRQVESRGTKCVPRAGGGSTNVVLLSEAGASRRQTPHGMGSPETGRSETAENEVDKLVWPLLDAGKTVRGIAAETGIKKATVGRSRLRWAAAHTTVAASSHETANLSHETRADEIATDEPCGEGVS